MIKHLKEQEIELCTKTMLSLCSEPENESLTFHQDNKNIPHDGDSGAQDKYGEQEGADGVSHLIFRLKETQRK